MIRLLQRACPHWWGWTYLPSRYRRWCRVCGFEQAAMIEGGWRDLMPGEPGGIELERVADAFMSDLERGLKSRDDI